MNFNLPRSTKNWTTAIGLTISIISIFFFLFLFVISVIFNQGGAYVGLLLYVFFPAFFIIGLILIPIGMLKYRFKYKEKNDEKEQRLPYIDMNLKQHRNALMIFFGGAIVLLFISAITSYEAFHYSESVQFCGTTCHTEMKPEYTAYLISSHARVKCVKCHVGSGANFYVRAKISGINRLYKTITNTVPKPIETPISNMRPASEICEACHWPQKFYDRTFRTNRHYLRDEKNTEWDIGLVIKVGSELTNYGLKEGIHFHNNPNISIKYVATDYKRQNIPWVKFKNLKTEEVIIYESEDEPLGPNMLDSLEVREMNCIDCHNRPAHKFYAPEYFINDAITEGKISKDLPEIKSISFDVSIEEYKSTDSAMIKIKNGIYEFYKENYPEIIKEKPEILSKSIIGLQEQFKNNIFPEMNVRWDKYPVNISHIKSKGCFRCHDGAHVSVSGKKISNNCNLCHTIVSQGNPGNMQTALMNSHLKFVHPGNEITERDWRESLCSDCHEGEGP